MQSPIACSEVKRHPTRPHTDLGLRSNCCITVFRTGGIALGSSVMRACTNHAHRPPPAATEQPVKWGATNAEEIATGVCRHLQQARAQQCHPQVSSSPTCSPTLWSQTTLADTAARASTQCIAHLSRVGSAAGTLCCFRRCNESAPSDMPTANTLAAGEAASDRMGTGYLCTVKGRCVSASITCMCNHNHCLGGHCTTGRFPSLSSCPATCSSSQPFSRGNEGGETTGEKHPCSNRRAGRRVGTEAGGHTANNSVQQWLRDNLHAIMQCTSQHKTSGGIHKLQVCHRQPKSLTRCSRCE